MPPDSTDPTPPARDAGPTRACLAFLADEGGGEVMETAIVMALICVAALVVIGTVATKLVGRWQAVGDAVE